MNIKKVAGYQQCNVGRLYNYARRKQINYYILEEFKIINPDIILFDGKLFDFLKTLIPLEEINSCKNIYHTASFEHPLFIKTCHPQAGKWKEGGKVIAAGWKAIYEAILEPYMVYLQKSC
jgi:hypothetical protein